ncbi:hypothetical protein [Thalassolituus sp.]|uniref:hypothetical protein n=1 Tax=Thalassolituus sp. TaxID=2030822 RepID=UPI0035178FB2
MTLIKRCLLLLSAVVLAACNEVEITAPENTEVYAEKPSEFRIAFSGNSAPDDLKIQLNNVDVTDVFSVSKAEAHASGSDLAESVFGGRNVLWVRAYNKTDRVTFYYDNAGPVVHIIETNHAAGEVSGYVADDSIVESLVLDGVSVDLDLTNRFTTSFADRSFNTFEATDSLGRTSSTTYARDDNEFNGISARLNQGGFDFLTSALEQELNSMDLSGIVSGMEEFTLLNTLGLFNLDMTVTSLNFTDVDVDLTVLENERLDTDIQARNVVLGFRLSGTIGFFLPYNSAGTMTFSSLQSGTDLLLDVRDSDLDIDLANTTINHSFPAIDFVNTNGIFNILDALTSAIVGVLAPIFENVFISILEQVIVPVMSDFIKDIPINLEVVNPDNAEAVNIYALPTFLDSKDRGVSVDLGTRIWAPTPSADIRRALGSRYVEGDTLTMGPVTPTGEAFHFGAAISANVINQALMATYEAGMLSTVISEEYYPQATTSAISVYRSDDTDIQDADEIRMTLAPTSAPYVTLMPADGAAGALAWYDVSLSFELYKPRWGEFRTLFGTTFNLEIPFEVNSTSDGYLSIGLEQLPTLFITETDDNGMIRLTPEFINATLDYFMPLVMPEIAGHLKVVPLPRIYNHTLLMREFWVAGDNNNSLALAGDLIPVSVTAAASAPTTDIRSVDSEDVAVQVTGVDSTGQTTSDVLLVNNGEVTIDLGGLNPNADLGNLEHRYRVDGGAWSIWKQREQITLRRLLAGDHSVEVCSRSPLLKQEVSCPVVNFTTTVSR